MTTPLHTCAGHIEVIGTDIDKNAGCVWKHMQCTVCAQTFSQSDPTGSNAAFPTTEANGEVSA